MKRILTLLLAVALCGLFCLSASAQAIVPELPCELTLQYKDDTDAVLSDYAVSVYRVAQLNEAGEATALPQFSQYEISFDESDRVKTAAELANFVQRDQITPDYSVKTDDLGEIAFHELQTGVYLITSETLTQDNTLLNTQPLLLDLPMIDVKTGVYAYDVTASPKPVRTEILKALNVLVLWRDKGNEQKRPKNVTIELYRDGKLFDTQTVTAENGWRYSWTDLSDSKLRVTDGSAADGDYADATGKAQDHLISGEHSWYVVERGADGYTTTYAVRPVNNTFIVINTIKVATPDQPLPQTGQLWWPVPLLAGAGLALVIFGRLYRGKSHD